MYFLTMHILYFLLLAIVLMSFFFFLLGCESFSKSQRRQCKCLEADCYIKLEKGLQIVNKAQSAIPGLIEKKGANQDKEPNRNGANHVEETLLG